MHMVISGYRIISIAAILVLIGSCKAEDGCVKSNDVLAAMQSEEISILNDKGKIIALQSLVADDSAKRAQGYQHICESVIRTTHILFVYTRPSGGGFHMRNVKAPLDIGFFDSSGKLFSVKLMDTYADGNSRVYSPGQAFQYALEGRAGLFSELNMSAGKTRLVINSLYDQK